MNVPQIFTVISTKQHTNIRVAVRYFMGIDYIAEKMFEQERITLCELLELLPVGDVPAFLSTLLGRVPLPVDFLLTAEPAASGGVTLTLTLPTIEKVWSKNFDKLKVQDMLVLVDWMKAAVKL